MQSVATGSSAVAGSSKAPSTVLVLPKELELAQSELPFVTLPHPRTHRPALFLPRPTASTSSVNGESTASSAPALYELQTVTPPSDAQRTWFLPSSSPSLSSPGHTSSGVLQLLTAIDPIFVLIPLLRAAFSTSTTSTGLALAREENQDKGYLMNLDDILEHAASRWRYTAVAPQAEGDVDDGERKAVGDGVSALKLLHASTSSTETPGLAQWLDSLCDSQYIELAASQPHNNTHYRPSPSKILAILRRKVDALSTSSSIFSGQTLDSELARVGLITIELGEPLQPASDAIQTDGEAEVESKLDAEKEELVRLCKIHLSITLVSAYLDLADETALRNTYSEELSPLTAYLAQHAAATSAATALHLAAESERLEAAEAGAGAKKQTKAQREAAKKKEKAKGSRGVEILKKVDTTKMKKLESFFGKGAVAAAKKSKDVAGKKAEGEANGVAVEASA